MEFILRDMKMAFFKKQAAAFMRQPVFLVLTYAFAASSISRSISPTLPTLYPA